MKKRIRLGALWLMTLGLLCAHGTVGHDSMAFAQAGLTARIHEGTARSGRFGFSSTVVGDLNGDGALEYAVGAPFENKVRVFDGRSGNVVYSLSGEFPRDAFGYSLGQLADVDGDGIPELLVGAHRHDPPQVSNCFPGKAYVFSGASGGLLHCNEGVVQAGAHGSVVTGLEDIDGDGVADYLVGAGCHLLWGRFTIYSGATGNSIYAIDGSILSPGLGRAAASLGDIDGDSRGDFVVASSATVTVYSGATGNVLLILDESRESLVNVGDVNLDGVSDFSIGGALMNATDNVEIYSGADFSLLATLPPAFGYDGFGRSVAPAGDQNGDGVPDVAVGAPMAGIAGPLSGRVGAFDVFTGAIIWEWFDSAPQSASGFSLISVGDLNCDGRDELLAGAQLYDPVGIDAPNAGAAIVVTYRGPDPVQFIRGDSNGDQSVNLADALTVLAFLFGNQRLPCEAAADFDDDRFIRISDVIQLVNQLFVPGASDPPPPYPDCGSDSTGDVFCCELPAVPCP